MSRNETQPKSGSNSRVLWITGGVLLGVGALVATWLGMIRNPIKSKDAIDFTVAKSIPVFEAKGSSGRVEPLDSFAHQAMDDVCNQLKGSMKLTYRPYVVVEGAKGEKLTPDQIQQMWKDDKVDVAATEYGPAMPLFDKQGNAVYAPTEMVLSWLSEPERWEAAPFIACAHKDLREIVGVPEKSQFGEHLKYVSPRQILHSEGLRQYIRELHEREGQPGVKRSETDKLVYQLMDRYNRYRAITLDPTQPLTAGLVIPPGGRREFLTQLNKIIELIEAPNTERKTLLGQLEVLAQFPDERLAKTAAETYVSLQGVMQHGQDLFTLWRSDTQGGTEVGEVESKIKLTEVKASVAKMRKAVDALEAVLNEHRDRLFSNTSALSADQLKSLGPLFRELTDKTRDLRLRTFELNVALYEDGNCLRVMPALNPGALSKKRDPAMKSQPWYSMAALEHGDELLTAYPEEGVAQVRTAWEQLKSSIANREAADRPAKIEAAEQKLYDSLAALGTAVEPLREKLVETKLAADERDAVIMAYTRWPNAFDLKRVNAELRYNQVDPFGRSWVISLIALACFSLSFGALRKPMYIAAVCVLCLCILWSTYGFYLRVYVTQWAPVTNMYETVVWVAYVTSFLGLWFLMLPFTWQGIKDAWRLNAIPYGHLEATPLDAWQLKKLDPGVWFGFNCVLSLARIALMVLLVKTLGFDPLSDGLRPVFAVMTPKSATFNDYMVWASGLFCLAMSVWFGPRLLLTALASIVFVPWDLYLRRGAEIRKLGTEVLKRWPFGVGATIMSAGGAWITWMAPSVLDESFSPLQPVLRSNFWLTVHVLSIVSSYAAGMLALGVGLIALSYYLFGTYRAPSVIQHLPQGMGPAGGDEHGEELTLSRRPPEEVSALAQYCYRAIQVAVLLLAVGTILGGIWADRSWGRFWGWDPKEVWALVSLLVYLAILHGRFAGWFNNFGLITGTILGAGAILFSWYGVNFALPMLAPDGMVGLHSYGAGAGGLWQVSLFYTVLVLYWAAAAVRYNIETSGSVTPVAEDAEQVLSKKHLPVA